MRMAGEHQIGSVACDFGKQIGLVRQDDHRFTVAENARGNCPVRCGVVRAGAAEAHQPEALTIFFQRHSGVAEHREAVADQISVDIAATDHHVVIAERGVTQRALNSAEDGSAFRHVAEGDFPVFRRARPANGSVGHEVAGDDNHVGSEAVEMVDNLTNEEAFSEFEEVDVGNLRDPYAAKGIRKPRQEDTDLLEAQFVTRDLS